MDRERRGYSFRARAGFTIYGLCCLIIFIYLQFPYDALKDRIERTLSSALGMQVTLGHMHSRLPLGIAADGLKINAAEVADSIVLHPRLARLFTAQLGLDIFAELISGEIEGYVQTPIKSIGEPLEMVFDVDGLDAAGFSGFLPATMRTAGIISGHGEFSGPSGSLEKAQGLISLQAKDGSIPLDIPGVPLGMIGFKTLVLDARLDKGMLTIEKAEMNGDISGTIQGAVRVRDQLGMSRLNLSGELILPESMKSLAGAGGLDASSGLKFSLRGTADRPRFRMLTR